MKSILNLDGVFFQFLSRVGDMIILNFLTLICCIPVVTAGAAMAALYKVTVDMVYDMEGGMIKGFFRAFRDNFKQATLYWLILLVVIVSLGCDYLLLFSFFPEGGKALYVLLAILACLVVCISGYMIPLMVRYENTLRVHVMNAAVLAIIKLPKTVAMAVLNLLPLIIAYFSIPVFAQTLIFWLFIGFSFVAYLNVSMMKSVYAQLEKGNSSVTLGT